MLIAAIDLNDDVSFEIKSVVPIRKDDVNGIMTQISSSDDLKNMWDKYQKKFAYAKEITYKNVMDVLRNIVANE